MPYYKNNILNATRKHIIIFEITNLGRLIIRPSGTEPKIKFYLELLVLLNPSNPQENNMLE